MSVIGEAINGCMRELAKSNGDSVTARFNFGLSFVGFNGHFPDNPILPGVCIIQCIVVMYETLNKAKIRIVEVENVKFMASVSCDEDVLFECTGKYSEKEEFVIRTKVFKNDKKVAVLKLRLRVDGNG